MGLGLYMCTCLLQLCASAAPFADTQPPPTLCGADVSAPLEQAGPGECLLLPPHSWHSPRPDGMVTPGQPGPALYGNGRNFLCLPIGTLSSCRAGPATPPSACGLGMIWSWGAGYSPSRL